MGVLSLCLKLLYVALEASLATGFQLITEFKLTKNPLCTSYQTKEVYCASELICATYCSRSRFLDSCVGFCFDVPSSTCKLYGFETLDATVKQVGWSFFKNMDTYGSYAEGLQLCRDIGLTLPLQTSSEEVSELNSFAMRDFVIGLISPNTNNFTTPEGLNPTVTFWTTNPYSSVNCAISDYSEGGTWLSIDCNYAGFSLFCQSPVPLVCSQGEMVVQSQEYNPQDAPCYKRQFQ